MGLQRALIFVLLIEEKFARVFHGLVPNVHQAAGLLARMLLENANVLLALLFHPRLHQHVNFQDDHFAFATFLPVFDAASASSAVNSGRKMVCSRSGPVETIPIFAPDSFSRKCRYSCAFLGSLSKLVTLSVDFFQPGIFV